MNKSKLSFLIGVVFLLGTSVAGTIQAAPSKFSEEDCPLYYAPKDSLKLQTGDYKFASLNLHDWIKLRRLSGIERMCIPRAWGENISLWGRKIDTAQSHQRALNISGYTPVVTGTRAHVIFENLINDRRVSRANFIYSTYDYQRPIEYSRYAEKRDFYMARNERVPVRTSDLLFFGKVIEKKESRIKVSQVPAIEKIFLNQDGWGETWEIRKIIIIPFAESFLAFDFQLDDGTGVVGKDDEKMKELFQKIISGKAPEKIQGRMDEIEAFLNFLKLKNA